jgi:exosortase A-associated hydrolase 1
MRRLTGFDCEGAWCAATLDMGDADTGLLTVSGGNEIRSGAHAGQAMLAAQVAAQGYPVFRYDRRGVGESEGENGGFEASAADIAAAISAFRAAAPQVKRIIAFGNCDAASALALFHAGLRLDRLILANPWTIETVADHGQPTPPSATAIRARYWARLKNPHSLIDLVTGKIDLGKLAGGLKRAAMKDEASGLAVRIASALADSAVPVTILLAKRDTTALAFRGHWDGAAFAPVRQRAGVSLEEIDSASHSFADMGSKEWLLEQVTQGLSPHGDCP